MILNNSSFLQEAKQTDDNENMTIKIKKKEEELIIF